VTDDWPTFEPLPPDHLGVTTVELRYPDHRTGPWRVTVDLHITEVITRCVGIHIRSYDAPGIDPPRDAPREIDARALPGGSPELNVKVWRSISLPTVIRQALMFEVDTGDSVNDLLRSISPGDREAYNDRSRIYPHEYFENVAAVYQDAQLAGEAPTKAVATKFKVTRSAAAKHVARCRAMGLLGATTQGRPGGVRRRATAISLERGDAK
jgi:hypothetical protein